MASLPVNHSNILQALNDVNKAAQLDVTGADRAHTDLLESIRKLTLVVEKPGETLMRFRFEVWCLQNLSHWWNSYAKINNRLQPLRSAAVRMALEANLLQIICENKGKPISAQVLAKITGYNALFISAFLL